MKRKSFIVLVILMVLSLPGIVTVQIVWLNNAIKLRKQEFRVQVIEALTKSSERIESRSYVNFFTTHNMENFPPPPPPVPSQFEVRVPGGQAFLKTDSLNQTLVTITTDHQGSDHNFSFNSEHVILSDISPDSTELDQEIRIIYAGKDSTRFTTGKNGEQEILLQRLRDKKKKIDWVQDKFITEVMIQDKAMPIDFDQVQKIVGETFDDKGILLPYQLAVIDSGRITNSNEPITDTLAYQTQSYQATLFPNDIIRKDKFVSVRFKGENRYFLKSLNWLMYASLFFTMLILTTFVLSIYFIMVQKKVSEVKSDFINNMTHEFKTPIATIGVAADALVNKKVVGDPAAVEEYAAIIKQENKRMNGHVEKILGVARIERKEVEFTFKPVDVHLMLEDICDSFSVKLSVRNGTLNCNLEAENPVILADREHVYNSIMNLLDNAEKYTTGEPFITVSTQGDTRGVTISVQDNGIGMSKQVQSKVFDTFYRVSTGNVHNVKGFGLGLSYVKSVVEAHKGAVSVESEPDKGSIFKLFLPYSR